MLGSKYREKYVLLQDFYFFIFCKPCLIHTACLSYALYIDIYVYTDIYVFILIHFLQQYLQIFIKCGPDDERHKEI